MKMLAIALTAPLLLIGAAYPDLPHAGDGGARAAADATDRSASYRPCRPGPGDDNCIQLYERGVRASYAGWLRQRGADEAPTRLAMGGPTEDRPRRSRQRDEAPRPAPAQDSTALQTAQVAGGTHCVETPGPRGETRGM
ncbi:hypothetical protein [Sphingosinicella sp. CPCC 101087]|uniref:hypothetical protein n=1 Tax=Sphingosinicella sp. CPCC 101087 TaxID=2497754 RepID=UPI00101DEACF|nr:hypothetical protein [Sphingosinicella sp. CPCC 101087]